MSTLETIKQPETLQAFLMRMLLESVPEALRTHFRFRTCGHCHRRATLIRRKAFTVPTGFNDETVTIYKYDKMPCCSANYVTTIEHETRREKIKRFAKEAEDAK